MYAGHAPLAKFELAELPPFSRILINFVCIVDTAKNPEARPQWPRQQRGSIKALQRKDAGKSPMFVRVCAAQWSAATAVVLFRVIICSEAYDRGQGSDRGAVLRYGSGAVVYC